MGVCVDHAHLEPRIGPLGLRLGVTQRAESSPNGVYPDQALTFSVGGAV